MGAVDRRSNNPVSLGGNRGKHQGFRPAKDVFRARAKPLPFDLLEKASVGVAPGVDIGNAGKRSVRFSYASSEENSREAGRSLWKLSGRVKETETYTANANPGTIS